MNKKFFSADSVRQALLQAARYFHVEPERVAYREVDRRHGFLRGRRRAVIEVDLDNPTLAPPAEPEDEVSASPPAEPEDEAPVSPPAEPEDEAPASPPAEPEELSPSPGLASSEPEELPTEEAPAGWVGESAEPAASREREAPGEPEAPGELEAPGEPEAPGELEAPGEPAPQPVAGDAEAGATATGGSAAASAEEPQPRGVADPELVAAARQSLDRLFELGRLDLRVESIEQGEERLEVELRGADEELLLEDRGRLLLAIQHLLPRMLRGLAGKSTPCLVDCDDFHEIRTEQLRDLAQRVASEVRNRRRSRTLEPMSPDERRIVHLTLADDPAVDTVSQGNGLFKRVQVRPQKIQPRGFDPFGQE